MALLAEELVEEWLNRQGYFTIRGIKLGVHETDLLAIRPASGDIECRHLEVQASVRPVSYITRVPRSVQKATGRAATSARVREDDELREGVLEWVEKKFDHPKKRKLRHSLCPHRWTRELVVHNVKHHRELEFIAEAGITVHRLADIIADLKRNQMAVQAAAGSHLVDLVVMTGED
jgi:hypothetical protein